MISAGSFAQLCNVDSQQILLVASHHAAHSCHSRCNVATGAILVLPVSLAAGAPCPAVLSPDGRPLLCNYWTRFCSMTVCFMVTSSHHQHAVHYTLLPTPLLPTQVLQKGSVFNMPALGCHVLRGNTDKSLRIDCPGWGFGF